MLQENNNCVIDTEMRDIMGKSVYIAEKPSVAQEFAKASGNYELPGCI